MVGWRVGETGGKGIETCPGVLCRAWLAFIVFIFHGRDTPYKGSNRSCVRFRHGKLDFICNLFAIA